MPNDHYDLLRAATALQVATFEHMVATTPFDRGQAYRAMIECINGANEAIAKIKRHKEAESGVIV
jgi:hypothetical protein